MNNKQIEVCPTCNQKIVEYSHNFSMVLAIGLWELYSATRPMNLHDLNLTKGEYCNFQKLQYWGLVRKIGDGLWKLTDEGRDFVDGKTTIQKTVWTFHAEVVRFEGEQISFSIAEVEKVKAKRARDYIETSGAHNGRLIPVSNS